MIIYGHRSVVEGSFYNLGKVVEGWLSRKNVEERNFTERDFTTFLQVKVTDFLERGDVIEVVAFGKRERDLQIDKERERGGGDWVLKW